MYFMQTTRTYGIFANRTVPRLAVKISATKEGEGTDQSVNMPRSCRIGGKSWTITSRLDAKCNEDADSYIEKGKIYKFFAGLNSEFVPVLVGKEPSSSNGWMISGSRSMKMSDVGTSII